MLAARILKLLLLKIALNIQLLSIDVFKSQK